MDRLQHICGVAQPEERGPHEPEAARSTRAPATTPTRPVGIAPNPADAEAILARARGINDGRVLRHTTLEA